MESQVPTFHLKLFWLDIISDLLQCTNEPNVSIPQMADLLIQRTQHQNWVVVFKSLISIHNIMNYGNEVRTVFIVVGQGVLKRLHISHNPFPETETENIYKTNVIRNCFYKISINDNKLDIFKLQKNYPQIIIGFIWFTEIHTVLGIQ